MRRIRREGECFPAFYGPAYRDWCANVTVCYPIPIHLFVRVYRDLVMRAREWWRPSYRDTVETDAFRAGWNGGYEAGERIGKTIGEREYKNRLLALFDAKYGKNTN